MRGIHLLTAHRMSCMGATSRFRFFDLIVIRAENPCSHSHVEEKISSWGIAWEASVEYEEAMLSQKFIGEQSLCFNSALSSERWSMISWETSLGALSRVVKNLNIPYFLLSTFFFQRSNFMTNAPSFEINSTTVQFGPWNDKFKWLMASKMSDK